MIRLVRCDDRLIHGQCVLRVLSDYDIRHILLADDILAQDSALRAVVLLAAPLDIQTEIVSVSEAANRLPSLIAGKSHTMLLVRSPSLALALYAAVPALCVPCNIGPVAGGEGAVKITDYCRLDKPELCAVEKMAALGVRVYFNQVIDQRAVEWTDVRLRFQEEALCGSH
jgi:mannose/fructose/N-acetylgalactosamine-specific phosphotransferase system component IIB